MHSEFFIEIEQTYNSRIVADAWGVAIYVRSHFCSCQSSIYDNWSIFSLGFTNLIKKWLLISLVDWRAKFEKCLECLKLICNFLTVFGDNWKKMLRSCKWIFRFDIRWKQTNRNRWITAGGRCLFCVGTTSSTNSKLLPHSLTQPLDPQRNKWESLVSNAVSVDARQITLESITGYVSIITSLAGVHVRCAKFRKWI